MALRMHIPQRFTFMKNVHFVITDISKKNDILIHVHLADRLTENTGTCYYSSETHCKYDLYSKQKNLRTKIHTRY